MKDPSPMSDQPMLWDTNSGTGSPESESGPTLSGLQDGLMIESAIPSRARASRSAQPVKRKGSRIDDTFGQTSLESSESEDLSWRLANRYRLQTASLGSTLFDLTWKARRTPSGQLIFAQRARARRTSETALSSWPTPQAHDVTTRGNTEADHHRLTHDLSNAAVLAAWPTPCVPNGGRVSSDKHDMNKHLDGTKAQIGLENAARLSGWPTPAANEYEQADSEALMKRRDECKERTGNGNGFGLTLGNSAQLAAWATPTVRDHKDGESEGTVPVNALLGRQVWLAGWQTPKLPSGGGQENRETPGGGLRKLEDQAILAGWPTPMAGTPATEGYNEAGNTDSSRKTVALLDLRTDSGGTQVGYYADPNGVVEIPVGGPLSAAHSRWLQGLPDVWDVCAATATALLRPLRRSSSKRTSKKKVCDV